MMSGLYILNEKKEAVPIEDMGEWTLSRLESMRRVASTLLKVEEEEVHISTVFLGVDHSFNIGEEETPPILFETMIFGGKSSEYQNRCSTWNEAIEMHLTGVAIALGEGEITPEISEPILKLKVEENAL
jgi:hypothetical protein